ncbi:RE1 [Symbiodinium sp. CCMP2592]|nr:RE1 [Symbiodinium sp. CCMP2592]
MSELRRSVQEAEVPSINKAEAATTKELEAVLEALVEPLNVTHTASQEEVRLNLDKWKESIQKELSSLLGPGVLVSHKGQEARDRLSDPSTTVIPLKGVFTAKPPSSPAEGLYRRKCRLVGCGNQATHVDADSLYAAGAPAEVVRTVLTQGCRHQWSAFTTDIKSAFTQTPIPPHAARRYLLRPPRWMVELGLAEPGEYYSLGKVLYGFKEAPAWWSEHRDAKLLTARFLGCHLEQGQSDTSIWRIMRGQQLAGYLVTYVDDFLIVSDRATANGLHQWLLDGAGWQTDGLSEAKPGSPIRFLGMQLCGYEDGHFSLDQEAYVDELVRSYALPETSRSKVVCPKELLFNEGGSEDKEQDEKVVRAAQKIAGECLWLSQRTRADIAYTTGVLCSMVSKDPHGALAVGRRVLSYLAHTKGYKLHLIPDPEAPPVRVFTDASFSPQGEHSYGGHIVEVYGVPVLWRASKQALISLSSAESELIQAVEGATYAEALMTVLCDLRIPCSGAELNLDNTASISFIEGSGNQRTRHLKDEIGTNAEEPATTGVPTVRRVTAQTSPCLTGLLLLLQSCACLGGTEEDDQGPGVAIEWPWELAVVTIMIVLSTLFVWEASGAPCRRRAPTDVAQIRAVNGDPRTRRSRKLQEKVKEAIDSVVSSPTEDEGGCRDRGRNKCPIGSAGSASSSTGSQGPTVVYGGINMLVHGFIAPSSAVDLDLRSRASCCVASAMFGRPVFKTAEEIRSEKLKLERWLREQYQAYQKHVEELDREKARWRADRPNDIVSGESDPDEPLPGLWPAWDYEADGHEADGE